MWPDFRNSFGNPFKGGPGPGLDPGVGCWIFLGGAQPEVKGNSFCLIAGGRAPWGFKVPGYKVNPARGWLRRGSMGAQHGLNS